MKINDLDIIERVDTIYHLDFGTITVFGSFLVMECKEGALLDHQNYKCIASVIQDHFSHLQSFGYISNRLFKYSTVPTELIETKNYITTKPRIAYVYYDEKTKQNSIFESNFYPFTAEFFSSLPEALTWITRSKSIGLC